MPPLNRTEGKDLVKRRHHEWSEFQRHWRFLADSYEGGNRYRQADYTIQPTAVVADGSSYAPWYTYGFDPITSQPYTVAYGQIVDRNLIPHLSETGTEGRDLYVMRLARTPVPNHVPRAVESHLSRIYTREVTRTGPTALEEWWADCDGRGTSADDWMAETVAPLLMVLGQLDLCFDHPPAPEGADVRTKADVRALGLGGCVASVVLPENLVWWRLDAKRCHYAEALVFERWHGGVGYRHWTPTESNFYDPEGQAITERSRPHGFGRVPIVRVFDRRRTRCEHVGLSRYESIAFLQRAIYNARSELILGDVQQSHAQLQGPEDFLQNDSKIPGGPDGTLPKKKVIAGSSISYVGWDYVDPPKGAQDAVRQHIIDFCDEADRDACLAKPAGMTTGTTVAQSGVSKIADQVDGNALLARVSKTLAKCERTAAEFALCVLGDGEPDAADLDAVEILYPEQFELYTLGDLAQALDDLSRAAQDAGALPETQGELMKRIISVALPGLSDDRLAELHGEVDSYLAGRAAAAEEADDRDVPPDERLDPNQDRSLNGQDIVAGPSSVLISPQPS